MRAFLSLIRRQPVVDAAMPTAKVLLGIKPADSTADLLMANGTYQDTPPTLHLGNGCGTVLGWCDSDARTGAGRLI
jgi:hypothetical protein